MKNSIRSVDLIFRKAIYLQSQGIPFRLIGTNGSYRLTSDNWKDEIFTSKFKQGLDPSDLGFVKRVKNYVIKNQIYLNFTEMLNPSMIKYIDTTRHPDGTRFDDVYEIDIDEAYWKTAFLKNVLSQDLYDEGSKFKTDSSLSPDQIQYKKRVRLIALGSLAKKQSVYEFTGKRILLSGIRKSELTELVWYSICKHVADIMQDLKHKAGSDFIMYWVDGIYVVGKQNSEMIAAEIEKHGYSSKIKKIHKIEYQNSTIFVYDTPTETRPFQLPNPNKKRLPFNMVEVNETAKKYSKV